VRAASARPFFPNSGGSVLHPNEIRLVDPVLTALTAEAQAKGPDYVEALQEQFRRQFPHLVVA
jgi:hypothetical protein